MSTNMITIAYMDMKIDMLTNRSVDMNANL